MITVKIKKEEMNILLDALSFALETHNEYRKSIREKVSSGCILSDKEIKEYNDTTDVYHSALSLFEKLSIL